MKKKDRKSGFTLLELGITLVIVAILAIWAMPSFTHALATHQVRTTCHRLEHLIRLAQSEAAMRHRNSHICALNTKSNLDIQGCQSATSWQEGALLFSDMPGGRPAQYDSKEAMSTLQPEQSIIVTANTPLFSINSSGRLLQPAITFQIRHVTDTSQATLMLLPSGSLRRTGC